MAVDDFFTGEVIKKIKEDIKNSNGQEIFLVGAYDSDSGKINDYNLLARGNSVMVPAIINDLKPGQMVIHNHPSGDLTPSAADIRVASRIGNMGVGFAIISNQVDDIYVVVETNIPEEIKEINQGEITGLFGPDGLLSSFLDGYEYREQQVKVVDEVIKSFNQHQYNLIEAGTGTGKSFAYLIPALYWAHENNRVVVISTNTINLQEQLIEKDLVLLKKAISFDFKAILVKGRGNYLCKRKLQILENRAVEMFQNRPDLQDEFINILEWIEETDTGTRSDLGFFVDDELWEEIASESDFCLRANCPSFNSCFFMKARKEVYSADLLVVNHHLLMADAVLKNELQTADGGILPDYKHLIIDEAHNLDDTATRHLGRPYYPSIFNKYLQRLFYNRFALIPRLRNRVSQYNLVDKKGMLERFDQKIIPQIQKLTELNKEYNNLLLSFFSENEYDSNRITDEFKGGDSWQDLVEFGHNLLSNMSQLGVNLNSLYETLLNLDIKLVNKLDDLLMELESYLYRCQHYFNNLGFCLDADDSNYVFWMERKKDYVFQENAPLDISTSLQELIWERLDNTILTSATLTVNNSFNFFKRLLGFEQSTILQVSSPFNYQKQAELIIPENIPPANSGKFMSDIKKDLQDILISFGGQTLILFTSYSMLNYFAGQLCEPLSKEGITLLSQGQFPRSYMIESFKKNKKQVMFGTVSFWEGIDIKGDNLKYLLIMKLPFPVPSEPVAAARMEKMEREGLNPFINYSIPRAVIRFKQGFGRLIRSKEDQGVVVIFDNRIITKSYGRIFINSLPEGCPVKTVDIKSLIERSSK